MVDFQRLREAGLEHIQNLSGDIWTDHNIHDPGITILEILAYALLDHGYRTNHDIRDVLARDKTAEPEESLFYTAAEILGNNPVSINDFRRLLLDIPGVRNAWLEAAEYAEVDTYVSCEINQSQDKIQCELSEKQSEGGKKVFINGLYNVLLELESVRRQDQAGSCIEDAVSSDRILKEVRDKLSRYRNLSEDFINIRILQEEELAFCAAIEIDPNTEPEEALTEMFSRIKEWLSPEPVFYTLQQMVEKGKNIEEIFEGRPLTRDSHGFIDLDELDQNRPSLNEIYVSDLYRVMLNNPSSNTIPSIRAVQGLKLFNYINGVRQSNGVDWCLPLTKGYRPVIAPGNCEIVCLKEGVQISFDKEEVVRRFTERLSSAKKIKLRPYEIDRSIPEGIRRNLGSHYSIQHDFPAIYRVGEGELPPSSKIARQAQALQLKGYLLFFDQLLANYLGQLSHVRRFFSLKPSAEPLRTYFAGSINSVPELNRLIRGQSFNSDGDQITGQSIRFKRGQVVFFPELKKDSRRPDKSGDFSHYRLFDTPEERDHAVSRIIGAFENEDFELDIVEEEDCKTYLVRFNTAVTTKEGVRLSLLSTFSFTELNQVRIEADALSFVFTTSDYFHPVDLQKEEKYTFEVVYNPPDYEEVLRRIGESKTTATQRRNRFLDHLLARFGEDFSDYALLRLASGESRNPFSLIKDKELFLADYPSIGERRSAGFDYSNRNEIWDTENVTGLERRVGRLMGIEEVKRHTLAPFHVEKSPGGYHISIHDFRGRTLLESYLPVFDHEDYITNVCNSAAGINRLHSVDCDSYHRFGFKLKDADSCTLALHPDYYSSRQHRNIKRNYLSAIFEDVKAHDIRYIHVEKGWEFEVVKDGQSLIKSPSTMETHAEALIAWIHFSNLADATENYTITEDPDGVGYGIQVTDQTGKVFGVYPGHVGSRDEATTLINLIKSCVTENRSRTKLEQNKLTWTWQYRNSEGGIVLESTLPFAERDQANRAMLYGLRHSMEPGSLVVKKGLLGWTYVVYQNHIAPGANQQAQAILIAKHPNYFSSEQEAEEARKVLLEQLIEGEPFTRKIGVRNRTYQYLWRDGQTGEALLRGRLIYPDEDRLSKEFDEMLGFSSDAANVQIKHDDKFRVVVCDQYGCIIAEHPEILGTKEAAQQIALLIVDKASSIKESPKPVVVQCGKGWYYRLTDKENAPVVESVNLFESRMEAEAALVDSYYAARMRENWILDDSEGKRIALKHTSGRILALSDIFYDFKTAKENSEEADRHTSLSIWRDWFASGRTPFYTRSNPGSWKFAIYGDTREILFSASDYPSEQDAALDLEKTLMLGCNPENYVCEKEVGRCRYRLLLSDSNTEQVIAIHPEYYPGSSECNEAKQVIALHMESLKPPYSINEIPDYYRFELFWETCDDRIALAFMNTDRPKKLETAQGRYKKLLDSYEDLFVAAVDDDKKHYTIRHKDRRFAIVHPHTYPSSQQAECVLTDLKKYMRYGGWSFVQSRELRPYRYRLIKDNATLARYKFEYTSENDRNEVMDDEIRTLTCRGAEYSTIELGRDRVTRIGSRYHFQLVTYQLGRCNPESEANKHILWTSATGYESREEAELAFDANYLDIMRLASDRTLYIPDCSESRVCFYYLLDPNNPGQILVQTPLFDTTTDHEKEVLIRLCHARLYPIIKIENRFCFRLADPVKNRDVWLSHNSYPSLTEAWEGFTFFLSNLAFAENYYRLDYPGIPRYSFEIREAGLYQVDTIDYCDPFGSEEEPLDPSPQIQWYQRVRKEKSEVLLKQISYKDQTHVDPEIIHELGLFALDCCSAPTIPPDEVELKMDSWRALEQDFIGLDMNTHFVVQLNEHLDCRYELKLVTASYVLARHTNWYHTYESREQARDELFDTIRCEILCPVNRFDKYFNPDQPCFPSVGDTAFWALQTIRENDSQTSEDVFSTEGLIASPITIELMSLARAKDCYVQVQDDVVGPSTKRRWGLFDQTNTLVALGVQAFDTDEELEQWREEAMHEAWEYPYTKVGDGYGFQLACGEEQVILESTKQYDSPFLASQGFCRLLTLIKDKKNYGASEPDDCGPLGIEIRDPGEIRAIHPSTYSSREIAELARMGLSKLIDAEGLHVVEHILLRPSTSNSGLFKLPCIQCTPPNEGGDIGIEQFLKEQLILWDEGREELGYLFAEDPYSFKCTVVIPYWGRRFRDLNFREYFERTLRQEAPSHIQLTIIWLTPQQMHMFENKWKVWLETNASGRNNRLWEKAHSELINAIGSLRNAYPPFGRFADNTSDERGNVIVLDQTILPS